MKNNYYFYRRKREVTLIEVIIAMSLTSIILTTLLFFYQQVFFIGNEIDHLKSERFQLKFVEKRLSDILPKIVSETNTEDFAFFSLSHSTSSDQSGQSLIFTFDNKSCLDKQFAHHVIGRLMLDEEKNLNLLVWPLPKMQADPDEPWPMKKEILLNNVETLQFEYFIPLKYDKSKSANSKAPKEEQNVPQPIGGWRKQDWLKEYKQLPVMVKMIITKSKKTNQKTDKVDQITFVFQLMTTKAHIIYD